MGSKSRKPPASSVSAADEALADRIRQVLGPRPEIVEKKMFGGLAFLYNGHMSVGINKAEMIVRVLPDEEDAAMARPGARPMDFTGKPMRGFLTVTPEGYASREALSAWVDYGLRFARTRPPK